VISAITEATGTISKSFRKYPSNVLGKHESKEMQKPATLGTAHILRKVLTQKFKTFNVGNNVTCSINCNCRIAATIYTL
jgi:hypothetical protein